jgi:hypothetical protein
MLRYSLLDCKGVNSTWLGGVGSLMMPVIPQAPFKVDVLDGWEHGPSDVLGPLHHLLEGLAAVDRAIPVPGCDATGQDALDGAAVVFGENPGRCWSMSNHR